MPNDETITVVGRFGRPHGVRGGIHIQSFTDPDTQIFHYKPLHVQKGDQWLPLEILSHHRQGDHFVARIKNTDSREQAAQLTQLNIGIERQLLPTLTDQYYWHDLEGLTVINSTQEILGHVNYMVEVACRDVMVVKKDNKEFMIPFYKPYLLAVSLKKQTIEVDWNLETDND